MNLAWQVGSLAWLAAGKTSEVDSDDLRGSQELEGLRSIERHVDDGGDFDERKIVTGLVKRWMITVKRLTLSSVLFV